LTAASINDDVSSEVVEIVYVLVLVLEEIVESAMCAPG
jgi:hypothetical protein